jgi:hypothetical protein
VTGAGAVALLIFVLKRQSCQRIQLQHKNCNMNEHIMLSYMCNHVYLFVGHWKSFLNLYYLGSFAMIRF